MSPETENSSDAFEEIEYSSHLSNSSSSSSSSIPPSRPSNQNASNQNASNQTDQNDTSKQPTELVYQLDWTTRDEIIISLNRYTRVIYGDKVETNEKLMHENTDLYQALISLPLKSSSNAPAGSCGRSSKVVLDLDSSARLQIIKALVANQSLIVDADSVSEESKMQLVELNNKLINSLTTLPVCVTTGPASAAVSNGQADRLTKRAELVSEVTRLNETIEELSKKNEELSEKNEELSEKNEERATQISSLKREIAECKQEVKQIKAGDLSEVVKMLGGKVDLGLDKKTTDFECELDGVGAFLESNETRLSKYFFAGGLAWNLDFKTSVKDEDRFLSIYLTASSYDGRTGWSINAVRTVSILSQYGGKDHSSVWKTKKYTSGQASFGTHQLISASNLRTGGYIKSNKIKVRVHLELDELVRT